MKVRLFQFIAASVLVGMFGLTAFADTLRMKDGTVIRGDIVGFKDQQFTVLIGSGAKNRRSKVTVYIEDVDTIEFDNAVVADNGSGRNDPPPTPAPTPNPRPTPANTNTGGNNTVPARYLSIRSRVIANDAANGWTNTGIVLRRGQRVRISASGTISLSRTTNATPMGLPSLRDPNKLMPNEATGGLIAVIGDDNDEFLFIGRNREFVAQRDGVLFLGINEDNLSDNAGAFDATVEVDIR